MRRHLLASARLLALCLVLLGIAYPLAVGVLGRLFFPFEAGGSLVRDGGRIIGSALIAQEFSLPKYFAPRPSAPGYDPKTSGGSNLGPTSAKLFDTYRSRLDALKAQNPAAGRPAPLELVAASASGLDPDISLGAALWQVPRVAAARGLSPAALESLVRQLARRPLLGFIGEWRVNVLALNYRLDEAARREEARPNE